MFNAKISRGFFCVIAGCDSVEIGSLHDFIRRYMALFEFFLVDGFVWPSDAPKYRGVEVGVIGPALKALVQDSALNFTLEDRLQCHVFCSDLPYHEFLASRMHSLTNSPADLIVMFNAGLWGYESWIPTLQTIGRIPGVIVLVTSYTVLEAEDDFDTIDRHCNGAASGGHGGVKWLWEEEANPNAGTEIINRLCAAPGSVYRDNGAWQCFQIKRS
jgi:hypothetical protein